MVHASTWSLQEVVPARVILWAVLELLEYEDIQAEIKLEDRALVEVAMRNGKVGMKYGKDREAAWTPVVRKRKKIARMRMVVIVRI